MYGVGVIVLVSLLTFIIFRHSPDWNAQEIIGYASIVASLIFVYLGILRYREKENGGQLSFGKGLGVGTLITLFPSVAFGLFSWLQMSILDPGYADKYYGYYSEKLRRSTPPPELEAALKELAAEKAFFSNPIAQFLVMFLTVFVIGIIITLISTLILKKNKPHIISR